MFQSSKQRKSADEQNLCVSCKKNNDCKVKPDASRWNFILQFCQRYETAQSI